MRVDLYGIFVDFFEALAEYVGVWVGFLYMWELLLIEIINLK